MLSNSIRQIDVSRSFLEWWMKSKPRGEFWALAVATLLFNLGMSIFMFLYNLFMLDLGFREQSLGVLASAMALGSMAGTIPMGIFARRFGARKILMTCLFLISLAFGAKVCLLWYPAQVAFSFLDGVMLCGWVVCLSPAVASVVEEPKRPFAFSVLFAVAVASCALGGFLGGHLPGWSQRLAAQYTGIAVSAVEGKRITLLIACAITALGAWPTTRLSSETRTQEVRWFHRPSPFLLRFLVASACWGAAVGAFNPFIGVFFTRYLGVQTAQLGSFFSIAQFVQAGAVLLVPLMVRRAGLITGIMLAQLATAATLGLLAAGHGLLQIELIYCGFMAAQHMTEPAIQSLLMDRVTAEERSGATAMNFLVVSVAQAGAAAVAGFAFARFGYPLVLLWVAGAVAVAAIIFRALCGPSLVFAWVIVDE
jgi:predicted MFS family arabinose efflux permease